MDIYVVLHQRSNEAWQGTPSFKLLYGVIVLASIYVLFQVCRIVPLRCAPI